jgi:hypothetical protein
VVELQPARTVRTVEHRSNQLADRHGYGMK